MARHPEYSSDRPVKIMIVDDHEMVRNGLKKIIGEVDDFEVIAEASNGLEAVQLARELSPHIILMDVNMPDMDGIEATRIITVELDQVCIIGLSMHNQEEVINELKRAGASAYLIKSDVVKNLSSEIWQQWKNNFST